MYRIDDATAATSLPTPEAAGTEGYFTEGNPATGTPATKVRGSWLNMIQEELRNVVTAGGLTPSKTTYNQVLSAIKRIGQNTVVLADTGAVNAYAAVNSPPLVAATWVDGVVQQVKIAHANTGASSYSPDGLGAIPIYGLGLQPLQGGELFVGGIAVLMRTTIAGVNSGNPICVLMECAGGAQQVAPATQSQHAVNLSQFVANFGSTGRFVLPNGLWVQWGPGTAYNSGQNVTTGVIAFPYAFPTACIFAGGFATSTANSSQGGWPAAASSLVTRTGYTQVFDCLNFTLVNRTIPFIWYAIGY